MATLKKRRGKWYARVLWYECTGRKREKQVPLRTGYKVTARERLATVNKAESDIKDGMSFSFPWMNEDGTSKVIRFTVGDAIDEWMNRRSKMGIRPKTLEINRIGLNHFTNRLGSTVPLVSISTKHIDMFIDYLRDLELSITTINMYLRTVKTMFRYYWKREQLDKLPMIDQISMEARDPIYITDHEFQSIMELDWLDQFYKKVFFFYRETGCRLREPFISRLDGTWLDIPNLSKGKKPRSIELDESLIQIYKELLDWCENCELVEESKGRHISKMFKKALRSIGADDGKHFHSLRHTFAIRSIVQNVPIFKIQRTMGHSSIITTEIYANMELKRLKQDFPTLMPIILKYGKVDTDLVDTRVGEYLFIDNKIAN